MQDQNKVYGFTLSLYEYPATIPTLWDSVKGTSHSLSLETVLRRHAEFMDANPDLIEPDNAMRFISDDGGKTYNNCHCEWFRDCVCSLG